MAAVRTDIPEFGDIFACLQPRPPWQVEVFCPVPLCSPRELPCQPSSSCSLAGRGLDAHPLSPILLFAQVPKLERLSGRLGG